MLAKTAVEEGHEVTVC